MHLDLRFALRQFVRNPGFTAVAILTLALGIGANTAIFSVIHSVLIKALPYPDADRLVGIFEMLPDGGHNAVSGGAFKDWREHGSHFSHLAIFEDTQQNLTGKGTPERVTGLKVSSEYLSTLGVEPIIGGGFSADADTLGGNNQVLVLTHQLWQNRYGGDPKVVGKVVSLDQVPYTVVGVLPPRALLQSQAQYLVPIVFDDNPNDWFRAGHWRSVVARLAPGATLLEAQTELRHVKQRLAEDYPTFKDDWSVAVVPLKEVYTGEARRPLLILLAAVALVLLISCTNVSNLLLARGNSRTGEMAIRAALGAHASRIIRQTLLESLLLALAGCGVGLLLAMFGIEILVDMVSGLIPQALYPELDHNVFFFSILAACACGILFGLLPALRASRPDLNHSLKQAERKSLSAAKKRAQSFLVVAEFALTLVLLIGAGLLLRSFARLLDADPGFNPEQTLAFDLSFPQAKYPDAADRMHFIQKLTAELAALPGVDSVGAASSLPLSGNGRTERASRMDGPENTDYIAGCEFVSGDYFSAMDITLLRGRLPTAADNQSTSSRVLAINNRLANDLYPNENPIGQQLRFLGEAWEIIGVVSSVRHFVMHIDPMPWVYGTQIHSPWSTSMVLRTSLPPLTLTDTVRKTILEADAEQPIANVRTLEQAVHGSLARQRTTLILLGLFALVAVSLACIGIYGVMSYAIGQRSRELCIRSILGAQGRDIRRLVLQGGMKPALTGISVGLVVAFALARVLESLLFEVKTHDPLVFLSSISLLALVAAISTYIPARRAATVNPVVALRND